jgi:hypothetical protein
LLRNEDVISTESALRRKFLLRGMYWDGEGILEREGEVRRGDLKAKTEQCSLKINAVRTFCTCEQRSDKQWGGGIGSIWVHQSLGFHRLIKGVAYKVRQTRVDKRRGSSWSRQTISA